MVKMDKKPIKASAILRKINTFFVVNAVLLVLAFIRPGIAFIASSVLLGFLTFLYCLGKWIGRRINKAVEKAELSESTTNMDGDYDEEAFKLAIGKVFRIFFRNFDEGSDPPVETWIQALLVLFFAIIYALAFWKWLGRGLLLTIPSFLVALVMMYTGAFGENIEIFIHTIIIYIFLRLYITFALNHFNASKKSKILPMSIKVLLESARIIVIFITVLNMDICTGVQVPPSLIHGIVATIAIDTIMKETVNYFTKNQKLYR